MPYGLFDYEDTIQTMGLSPRAMDDVCPVIMPPICPDGSRPREIGTSKPDARGCTMPIFAPCPRQGSPIAPPRYQSPAPLPKPSPLPPYMPFEPRPRPNPPRPNPPPRRKVCPMIALPPCPKGQSRSGECGLGPCTGPIIPVLPTPPSPPLLSLPPRKSPYPSPNNPFADAVRDDSRFSFFQPQPVPSPIKPISPSYGGSFRGSDMLI
jgi:hypothetical protein